MGCCLLSAAGSRKPFLEKGLITYTLATAGQGLLLAILRGWGLLKQCSVRNAIPTTKPKAIFFLRQHAPVSFLWRPSLRITGYGNFLSGLCSHSLSLGEDVSRWCPRKHLFILNPLVRERSFARSSPQWSSRLTALFFDYGYLTCTVQDGELLPNPRTQSFIITVTETTKEGWQRHTHNRPLQRGTNCCLVVAI